MSIDLHGHCEPGYGFLRDLLAAELESGHALGKAAALVVDGATGAHLWGGYADAAHDRAWRPDTLSCLF
ncbi:serine hydrolase, partial [Enterococcus casseliflavus]|uniref:serine hydrolase n=1 Tax=Enterococcus casseliflavus TaxID=37734 RepID=UPI003D13D702